MGLHKNLLFLLINSRPTLTHKPLSTKIKQTTNYSTPSSRVLEKLIVPRLLKKFLRSHGSKDSVPGLNHRSTFPVFAKLINSMRSYSVPLSFFLISTFHLHVDFPRIFFLSVSSPKLFLHAFIPPRAPVLPLTPSLQAPQNQ